MNEIDIKLELKKAALIGGQSLNRAAELYRWVVGGGEAWHKKTSRKSP